MCKRNNENWDNYQKGQNICNNHLRKIKEDYAYNLNRKDLNSNKKYEN